VTHALDEVVHLADSLVLIETGKVLAAGPLSEIAARSDVPISLRDDAGAILAARVASHDPACRLTRLEAGRTTIWVPLAEIPMGAAVRVRVLAREVILARQVPEGISVHNVIAGTVRAISEDAARHASLVEVVADAQALLARVTPDAVAKLDLAPGKQVFALFKSMGVDVVGS
jgi:molybdate transport system ATP-binding protein